MDSKTAGGLLKGKDLFSDTVWRDEDSTSAFRTFIASLRQKIKDDIKATSQTHKLIRRIRDNKKLLRCYTQNIDGLEARDELCLDMSRGTGSRSRFTKNSMQLPQHTAHNQLGGKMDGGCEVVQLHGDLDTVRCNVCQRTKNWTANEQEAFLKGETLRCQECELEDVVRQAAGKRGSAIGNLRPNIVLYGEDNPMETEIGSILSRDLTFGADLLLIMGTSLQVHGLKAVVKEFAKAVHSKKTGKVIFINLSEPSKSVWKDTIDYWIEMDCDMWAKDKLRMKQSELDLKTKKVSKADVKDKENIQAAPLLPGKRKSFSTPAKKRSVLQPKLPTPSSVGSTGLAELDPISATSAKRSFPDAKTTITDQLPSPPPSKRRKVSHNFEVWDANETVVLEDLPEASIATSPCKGRKRKLKDKVRVW